MGRPPKINRDDIVEAGIRIVDEVGPDGLTMAALAGRLGVTTMAFYRHVADRADLLDGMVDRLLTEADPLLPADARWDEHLVTIARALRTTAQRHPGAFPLVLTRAATSDAGLRTRRAVVSALRAGDVPSAQADQLERVLSTAVLGFAVSEVAGRFQQVPARQLDADFEFLLDLLAGTVRAAAAGETRSIRPGPAGP